VTSPSDIGLVEVIGNATRLLTVGEAVSAIANYCAECRKRGKEPLFSDIPMVLRLRAAVTFETVRGSIDQVRR
jgi:hypothetical protein